MAVKKPALSIVEMLDELTDTVEISPAKEGREARTATLRPLSVTAMVQLMHANSKVFFELYVLVSRFVDDHKQLAVNLGPIMGEAPEVIAQIIATSLGEEDIEAATAAIQDHMPVTVQLIALEKVWRLSVPDPKKFRELSSGVMAQWQRHNVSVNSVPVTPPESLPTILPVQSNSSSETATE